MKRTSKGVKILKSVGMTLALPVTMFLIMELLVYITQGKHLFNSILDLRNLIRGAGIGAAIAFALSMNLTSGRMDLSLGAQRVAGTILGGLLAQTLGLSGIWYLVFALAFGILFGALVGAAFVTLRVPPMVLGIGMACILECVGFAVSGGVGLRVVGMPGTEILSDARFTLVVIAVMVVFMLFLMTYTRFSYNFRAVRGSQQIAKNSGINVFLNVAICYTVAGGLVCVAGILDSAFSGSMNASMGLTSNGSVMANMFAMMIGCTFLARYVNQAVGVLSAAVALRIFAMGLTAFNVSDAVSSCINMALFIAFLVWQANSNVLKQRRYDRARIAQAQELKRQRAAAAA
jgi:ribose/xylose/arabinose/galactoside ABC-type transport system permease subunit